MRTDIVKVKEALTELLALQKKLPPGAKYSVNVATLIRFLQDTIETHDTKTGETK